MTPSLAPAAPRRRRARQLDAEGLAASAAPGLIDQGEVINSMPAPRRRVMHQRQARAEGVSPGLEAAAMADRHALEEAKARLAQSPKVADGREAPEEAGDILSRIAAAFGKEAAPPRAGLSDAAPAPEGEGIASAVASAPAQALAKAVAARQDPGSTQAAPLPLPITQPRLPQPLGQIHPRKPKGRKQPDLRSLLALLAG